MGRGTQDRMFSKSPLTREEEIEVAKQILSPDPDVSGRAVEKMVLHNARFVRVVVRQYVAAGNPREDDLIQEGMLGLCESARRYDYRKTDGRFIDYARKWVSGRIKNWLKANARDEPSFDLPTPDTLDTWTLDTDPPDALDHPAGMTMEEVTANDTPAPDRLVDGCLTKRAIMEAIRLLRPSYALVLAKRYGIGGDEPMTQDAIGAELGIGQDRVCRIEEAAIKAMRKLMGEEGAE